MMLPLEVEVEVEATIKLDGRSWTVADVRQRPDDIPLVICIVDA